MIKILLKSLNYAELNYTTKLILLCLLFFTSCSLFETRKPESPEESGGGIFVPPTTPEIVIDNLIEAITNKNVNNYTACFLQNGYTFVASSEAINKFPSIFDKWLVDDERRYFLSLSMALEKNEPINIAFSTKEFPVISADSAILITNYTLNCNLLNLSYADTYTGSAIFTIIPTQGGLWAIARWQDFSSKDTPEESWSNLKAYFNK